MISIVYILFIDGRSSGKRNVTVWHPSVRPSVCHVGILTMPYQGAACDTASVHFGPTARRTDIIFLWFLFFRHYDDLDAGLIR